MVCVGLLCVVAGGVACQVALYTSNYIVCIISNWRCV